MPNTREKLIELLEADPCVCFAWDCVGDCKYAKLKNCFGERYADHLIANGVTIQDDHHWATEQAYKNGYADGQPKWISVKERLPEKDRNVLVIDRITGEVTTAHLNEFHSFVFRDGRGHGASHWMPLPEAPKDATE